MDKSICFTTVVSPDVYLDYVPLFAACVLKSYPESVVRVYVTGLAGRVGGALGIAREFGSVEIVGNYKLDYPKGDNIVSGLRFFVDDPSLDRFDYQYICDVDITIIKEFPSLTEQHIRHASYLNLPYSNVIRPFSGSEKRRVSGLHFIVVKSYYEKVRPYLSKYNAILRKGDRSASLDEDLLYQLLDDAGILISKLGYSKGTDYDCYGPEKTTFRPHHGVHLGLLVKPQCDPTFTWLIENTNAYRRYSKLLLSYLEDERIDRIINESGKHIQETMSKFKHVCEEHL